MEVRLPDLPENITQRIFGIQPIGRFVLAESRGPVATRFVYPPEKIMVIGIFRFDRQCLIKIGLGGIQVAMAVMQQAKLIVGIRVAGIQCKRVKMPAKIALRGVRSHQFPEAQHEEIQQRNQDEKWQGEQKTRENEKDGESTP